MQPSQNSTDKLEKSYEKENRILRQAFLARQKRLTHQQCQQIPKQLFKKQEIKREQPREYLLSTANKIYLNTLIYDTRSKKPDFFIRISSFFQQDPRRFGNSISQNIESIFITTYGFQMEPLQPLFKSGKPFTILNHSDQHGKGKIVKNHYGFKNFTLLEKQKTNDHYGVFHTKLWLIKFKQFLRVVIGTGNQHFADWTHWQNAFWYQDFGLKKLKDQQNQLGKIEKAFDYQQNFKQTLSSVIKAMLPQGYKLEQAGIRLLDYSYKNISAILIPSIPGKYQQDSLNTQGLQKIKNVLRLIGNKMTNPMLTYNSTSLGALDEGFCKYIYTSFAPFTQKFNIDQYRLVYPTEDYIKNQTCGAAQTLFLTVFNYEKSPLKKKIFYQFKQNPENCIKGCIPHLKTIIVEQEEQNKCILYLGSHNMTRAAWGSYNQKNKTLTINNSQLGLLFIEKDKRQLKRWLPYKYPSQKYGQNQVPYMRDRQ